MHLCVCTDALVCAREMHVSMHNAQHKWPPHSSSVMSGVTAARIRSPNNDNTNTHTHNNEHKHV